MKFSALVLSMALLAPLSSFAIDQTIMSDIGQGDIKSATADSEFTCIDKGLYPKINESETDSERVGRVIIRKKIYLSTVVGNFVIEDNQVQVSYSKNNPYANYKSAADACERMKNEDEVSVNSQVADELSALSNISSGKIRYVKTDDTILCYKQELKLTHDGNRLFYRDFQGYKIVKCP